MNILFVFYYPSGGVETLARQRSHALKQMGINFDFLYYSSGPGLQNITSDRTYITNSDDEIAEILRQNNYAVIMVCSDFTFLERARRLNYQGLLIYEVQGMGTLEHADLSLAAGADYVPLHANAILSPKTPHLLQLLEKYYPGTAKFAFHNCINTDLFRYKDVTPPANIVIGWVGRLEFNKNWQDFLTIGASVIRNNPQVELWMFEDNTLSSQDERTKFYEKITALGLEKKIRIINNAPHNQMPQYLSEIASSGGVLLSTSKVEGFGYALLEAMACSCPVVSSNSDGVLSFLIHNVTGKLYPQGEIGAAINEINELITDKEKRKEIIDNALLNIHSQLTPAIYANNFIRMLRHLGLPV